MLILSHGLPIPAAAEPTATSVPQMAVVAVMPGLSTALGVAGSLVYSASSSDDPRSWCCKTALGCQGWAASRCNPHPCLIYLQCGWFAVHWRSGRLRGRQRHSDSHLSGHPWHAVGGTSELERSIHLKQLSTANLTAVSAVALGRATEEVKNSCSAVREGTTAAVLSTVCAFGNGGQDCGKRFLPPSADGAR